jgi:hypothetical protein
MFINVQPYVAQTLNMNPHGGYSNPFSMIGTKLQTQAVHHHQMLDLENFDISSHDESIGQTSSVDYD